MAVNFPSVPKTLAPFKPTAPAKTTVSACANFSAPKTGQVSSAAATVTSTTVKQLPTPITKSTTSPSTVTVVAKSQSPTTVSSTAKTTKPIVSSPGTVLTVRNQKYPPVGLNRKKLLFETALETYKLMLL